jgi:hypothetical protein
VASASRIHRLRKKSVRQYAGRSCCGYCALNPMCFLRFRHSVRILPFLRLNIGKRGVSTSIGVRGAHITTVGHGQVRETVGLQGSASVTRTSIGRIKRTRKRQERRSLCLNR